ncbi:MAG: PhoU domain-containing protein [Caldisphaera sp.]|jgi:phosphate uptake regulator|nr:MAG: hypothetical protein C0201_04125 [Caldisphaera sp.]PMP92086.1 MAG: hypothetical protein C0171_01545 [Caldisphaera sp.]
MTEVNQKENVLLRKVQITGGSTYIISIPKEWAKKLSIDKGEDILMEMLNDGSIKLYNPKIKEEYNKKKIKEIDIDPRLLDSAIIMEIISAYLAGYNSIKLIFSPFISERVENIVNTVRNKVVGLDIIEQTENSILLQVVVDLTLISVKQAANTMIKMLKTMTDDFINSITNKDVETLSSIIKRDDVIDKLYLYISKQINLALQGSVRTEDLGMKDLKETVNIYTTIKSIERIADHIVSMSSWLVDTIKDIEMPEELLNFINKVKNEVIKVTNCIESEINIDELVKSYSNLHGLIENEIDLIKSLRGSKYFYELYPIFDGLRRALAYSIDIIESQVSLEMLRNLNKKV